MSKTTTKEHKMTTTAAHVHATDCDICHQPILAGEKIHDDGDEIAHASCVKAWFRGNFGREGLS